MRRSTIAAAVAVPKRARRKVWKAAVILLAREEDVCDNRRAYLVWAWKKMGDGGCQDIDVTQRDGVRMRLAPLGSAGRIRPRCCAEAFWE